MSDQNATTSLPTGGATTPPETNHVLYPARVEYVVQMYPVPDKLGMGPDPHLRMICVIKLLVDENDVIVQNLGLVGCSTQDIRVVN